VRAPICSDHSVPVAKLKNQHNKERPFKRTIYDYSKLDIANLLSELQRIDWTAIVSLPSVDEAAAAFSKKLQEVTNICVPHKLISVRPNDAPWFNESIRKLIQNKDKVHNQAKTSDLPDDWALFRKTRNHLTQAIRDRKLGYLDELDDLASTDENIGTKRWWKIVKQFMTQKGYDTSEIPPIELNNYIYHTSKEKSTIFNDFFMSQSQVDDNLNDPLPQVKHETSELTHINLTENEVKEILKNLNPKKAIGPDSVSNKILIESRPVITPSLTYLFNRCLANERFPLIWKTAHVSPIHKKGRKDLCNNYRPISLLSCVGKVLEKCIQQHVFKYLTTHSILTSNQSGFIPGDSTVYHLLSVYHDLCSSLDKKITVQAIFFDISKAFDKLSIESGTAD
jgi:hypothetical protein